MITVSKDIQFDKIINLFIYFRYFRNFGKKSKSKSRILKEVCVFLLISYNDIVKADCLHFVRPDNIKIISCNIFYLNEMQAKYNEHSLSRTFTGPAKKSYIVKGRDSGKFKILVFYKELGKPNTVFTSVLNRRENMYRYFYSKLLFYFRLK